MKKMIKNLMLVAVAAMAFVGCQNDNDEMNATVKKTVFEFTANIEETTRSYFGEKEGDIYPTLWEENEYVRLVAYDSVGEIVATPTNTTFEAEEGATTAKITATFEGELDGVAKLVAYIGSSWNYDGTLNLDEQFASQVGKVNHALISDNAWDGKSAVVLNFSHAVAYGNMTITESPVAISNLSKVIVALDGVEYSIGIGDMLESLNIWFACDADEDLETFNVSLVDKKGVTYSKSVTMASLPEDKEPLKFIKGHVSKFSISGFVKEKADHAVEFTEMAGPVSEYFGSWAGTGMKYTFSNDAGDTMQITFSEADGNPLKAGTYTKSSACEDGCFYENGTWIKLADADDETLISNGEVVVALVDDVYTVTYTGTIAGETYETTFTGNVAVWEYFMGHWYRDTNYGIFARTVSGDEFYFDMYCDSSVGHVIPEGTYTYGWTTPYFQYSTVNGSSITDGTVTVAHLESGYQIDINVTTANGNFVYSFSGVVGIKNSGNDFRNPPIAYADYTIDATFSSVEASYNEYDNSFELAFVTEEDATYGIYNINLQLYTPKSAENNGLIPAGTYTIGGAEYQIGSMVDRSNAQPADASNLALKSATLTVAHLVDGYELTLELENVMKTKINGTYEGKIAKADEYNDFRNPGDATKLATPQNVNYSLDGSTATITWDAVDNAEHYEVSVNGAEAVSVNGTTYPFDAEYDTYYSVGVVAVPAVNNTSYKNSDAGYIEFTTPKDINAAADYNIKLTKITSISGNTIRFEGDNSQDKMKLEFNSGLASIEAGNYAVVSEFTSSTALEVKSAYCYNMAAAYNSLYDYFLNSGDLVNVAKDGDVYTIIVLSTCYPDGNNAMDVKLTYTGKLEVATEGEGGEGGVAATTFNFYGRWDSYYGLTSKSSGVYKLVGENFDIDFAIYYTGYNQTTGALVPGTYTYVYNYGYYPGNGSGYDGDSPLYAGNFTFAGTLNDQALQYNYDSTLVVTDSGITLTIVGGNPSPFVITAGQPTKEN